MTREPAQAGNRASRTEHYLQWWENSPEWNTETSAADKRHNSSLLFQMRVCGRTRAVVGAFDTLTSRDRWVQTRSATRPVELHAQRHFTVARVRARARLCVCVCARFVQNKTQTSNSSLFANVAAVRMPLASIGVRVPRTEGDVTWRAHVASWTRHCRPSSKQSINHEA